MNELFKNKYRITSARLQSWNYANEGMYFITICTTRRECYFGEIIEKTGDSLSSMIDQNVDGGNDMHVETQCIASLPTAPEPSHKQQTLSIQSTWEIELSAIGQIARVEWLKTIEMRPDMNLELGEYVIMPNHVHGIILIGENRFNDRRDAMHRVSTGPNTGGKPVNKF